jgi:hypothetical protein
MNINRALSILAICTATGLPWFNIQAQAQNAAVAYEEGVNAFFAGRPYEAESFLSQAIEWNSQDPRAYYFRALSLSHLGRCELAEGDMLTGATLEAQQPNRYSIGSALERIQGPQRLVLEAYRRQARLSAASVLSLPAATGATAPNATFREGEADVVREKKFVPLEELLRPEGPRTITVEPPAESIRPAIPPQPGTPAAGPEAQPATPPQEKDPFADDSGAAAAPSTSPPPAPSTPPQEVPKPATPPAAEDENPFGG